MNKLCPFCNNAMYRTQLPCLDFPVLQCHACFHRERLEMTPDEVKNIEERLDRLGRMKKPPIFRIVNIEQAKQYVNYKEILEIAKEMRDWLVHANYTLNIIVANGQGGLRVALESRDEKSNDEAPIYVLDFDGPHSNEKPVDEDCRKG